MTQDAQVASPGFKVRDFVDAATMKNDMAFSTADLNSATMQQASLFAHYGVLYADAEHQADTIKMLLENTEAAVYKLIRDRFVDEGEKFTEALLEKSIARHPKVIEMKRAHSAAKRVASIGKIAVEGFRHRRDMLVQHSSTAREELKGELRIRERTDQSSAAEIQKQSVLDRIADRNTSAS